MTPDKNNSMKILIVDDEPAIIKCFQMILKIKDCEIETAVDNESALEILEKKKFDLIFTDLNHPCKKDDKAMHGAGLKLLEIIKEKYPLTEVIVDTASAGESDLAVKAISLGAFEFLRKPFLIEQIYELLERVAKKKGLR
jgi:DNA-binding NtrC family response regulator